ncbi:MAG TPA: M14 family zinc carboxypeptidase [Mycobacteriales bacterium]|nr:M14 family zinc carboxypeptidase [Mycobacteriales bacterium]
MARPGRWALSALTGLALLLAVPVPQGSAAEPPQTGFEANGGTAWTTHKEELAFLDAVDKGSERVEVEVIGRTAEGRPLHLVRLGHPAPRPASVARTEPVELHVCSQHGNEPAGRDACLSSLRDLAFTTDAELIQQLADTTILFVPTANPDGRENNARTNTESVDINRDHLNLVSPEAQVMAQVVLDYQPDISVDHHEYGPGTPVVYDDEVLYLWPRNLNVDSEIRDIGVEFSKEHLNPCLADAGYTSDEYGLNAVGALDVQQTAGDGDEGINRNLMGLRHSVGILIESAVTPNPTNVPLEAIPAENQKRRVASQVATITCTLSFMRANGERVAAAQQGSVARKIAEGRAQSAPVYFQGQDEDTTVLGDAPPTVEAPAPCAYDLTSAQAAEVAGVLDLHGIVTTPRAGGVRVSMAQGAEPVIPLLLDARNEDRAATDGTPVEVCPASGPAAPAPVKRATPPRAAPARPAPAQLPSTGAGSAAVAGMALLVLAVATAAVHRDRSVTLRG